ncbi:ArsR/SmtB family transcription factor [Pseudomonas sp. RA_105y_Pfl1_P41]|uniref:ArsR/SmtB family transcription factor n=1 Tax=Pseudomonas sp. RA_105y_Pfl1_P41 TaxID=3088700 RepID=UPI0030DC5743
MTMTNATIKNYEELAELTRTLGHGHRLALLDQVSRGEHSVERLAELCGVSVANASQHLQNLRRSGLVLNRREGKRVLYRLGEGPINGIIAALNAYLDHERLEVSSLVADVVNRRELVERITRAELIKRMQDGCVTLLDVRPESEYAKGHLPGAINIAYEELEKRIAELPVDSEIIAYCRGPYCLLSDDAVIALQSRGMKARRLQGGVEAWEAEGHSIVKGSSS